jgi:hypothetical protein
MVDSRIFREVGDGIRTPIRVQALRGGTVSEVSQFLTDLNEAYSSLERFDSAIADLKSQARAFRRIGPPEFYLSTANPFVSFFSHLNSSTVALPPSRQLELSRVNINSPGFWEMIGQLNPLQQIREYLNDRHERRKDKEYREAAERRRLDLENEALSIRIAEDRLRVLEEQLRIMREIEFDDGQLRQVVWQNIGIPLAKLGTHQDTRLIGRVLNQDEQF